MFSIVRSCLRATSTSSTAAPFKHLARTYAAGRTAQDSQPSSTLVLVRCIPRSWTDSNLEKLFAEAGAELEQPVSLRSFDSKADKVFTLVEMRTPEDQERALGIIHPEVEFHVGRGSLKAAPSEDSRTMLMVRNVPPEYNTDQLSAYLDSIGIAVKSISMPQFDSKKQLKAGKTRYAIIDVASHEDQQRALDMQDPTLEFHLGKGFFTQPKMSYASPQQVVLKYRRGRIVSKKSRSGFDYPELDRSSSGPSSRGGDGGRGRREMGQDRGGSGGLGAGGRGAEGGGEKRYPSPSSSSLGGGRGSRGDRGETKNPYDDI